MTLMLATVTGPEEAEIAIAGGADIVEFAGPDALLRASDLETLRQVSRIVGKRRRVSAGTGALPADPGLAIAAVRAVAEAGADCVLVPVPALDQPLLALLSLPRDIRLIAVLLADRDADLAWIGPLAGAGFAGALLDIADRTGGRLLDHIDSSGLARFLAMCRARGMAGGFAGELEAPDVPRLLALDPHVLGFRRALCHGADRRAGLDGRAVAAIRRLIPPHGEPGRPEKHAPAQLDRVYVRDFVLEMSIGAYRHEQGRPQRVRFDVSAEVPPAEANSDDIGDVFSYDVILDTIRRLAENRHVKLVETLAEEIAARLLEHEAVVAVTVKVEKLDVAAAAVGVEIRRRKSR